MTFLSQTLKEKTSIIAQFNQNTLTNNEQKESGKQTNRWGWWCETDTLPEDRHHNRIPKNMHNNLNVGKTKLHTARVRQSNTVVREGGTENGERKKGEGERDGKDNSFHRKKNRLSHWRGGHICWEILYEMSLNVKTERRLDSRVTD